ncbi:PAS domain-containing protein [Rhodovulum euryhalinum]|uniref:PAS domain-containing protein n=1 Tax=Rhodovulum euryhalinum TaxID=35805 RepID=A0A4R2KGZ8_9RHOB|nr:PAS domain-containing protein [Rhodovulum euryhalinum]TCO69739.1 PAS domain-containing protein [Rhodovulum euryhalinum]
MSENDKGLRAAVIALAGYRGGNGLAPLDAIEAYWREQLESRGVAPSRAELDPRGFSKALTNCFIAEAITPRHLRLRLTGQHLSEVMGMDMRGMPLSALILPDSRPHLEQLIAEALAGPARPTRINIFAPPRFGQPALYGGMVLLPLRNEPGAPQRMLGAFATVGKQGRAPRRFRILGAGAENRPAIAPGRPVLQVIEGGLSERV